jgi:hypothetical protein
LRTPASIYVFYGDCSSLVRLSGIVSRGPPVSSSWFSVAFLVIADEFVNGVEVCQKLFWKVDRYVGIVYVDKFDGLVTIRYDFDDDFMFWNY